MTVVVGIDGVFVGRVAQLLALGRQTVIAQLGRPGVRRRGRVRRRVRLAAQVGQVERRLVTAGRCSCWLLLETTYTSFIPASVRLVAVIADPVAGRLVGHFATFLLMSRPLARPGRRVVVALRHADTARWHCVQYAELTSLVLLL